MRAQGSGGAGARKALLQVPDQIIDVLDADRQSDGSRTDAGSSQLLLAQLPVRCARRMNDEALGVAHVREVRPERYTADEVLTGFTAASDIEGEHGACAARQVLVCELAVLATSQTRVPHVGGELVRLEMLRNLFGILDVPCHPQRQRFESLEEQERIEGAHAAAEIAQRLGTQLHQVAVGAEGLVELEAVISGRGFRDHREAAVRPVELPRVYDHSADTRAVAADEFGRRVQHDVGSPLDRAA